MTDATLRDLAAGAAGGDASARRELAGEARAQARDIVAQGKFHADGQHHEGPLAGVFRWLGDRLEDLTGALPGGSVGGWVLLVLVAAVVTAALASWWSEHRRRAGTAHALATGVPDPERVDPDHLERQAAEAERAGDLDLAVRLRFLAGLLRLDAERAIELRPSLTSGEVGRLVASPRYDALATAHDAIAYGGRDATPGDATAAREEWPVVVREARR